LAFSSEVRVWAVKNGHQVAEKGRMSAGVVAAYRAAAGGKKSARQSARRRTPAPTFSG
jgi:Lsr2